MITVVNKNAIITHPRCYAKDVTDKSMLLCYNIKSKKLMVCKVNKISVIKDAGIKVKDKLVLYKDSKTFYKDSIQKIEEYIGRIQYNKVSPYKINNVDKVNNVEFIQIEMADINCVPLLGMEMFIAFIEEPIVENNKSENVIKENDTEKEENKKDNNDKKSKRKNKRKNK